MGAVLGVCSLASWVSAGSAPAPGLPLTPRTFPHIPGSAASPERWLPLAARGGTTRSPRGRGPGPAGAEAAPAPRSGAVPGWSQPCPCQNGGLADGARPGEAPGAAQADKPGYLRVFANALTKTPISGLSVRAGSGVSLNAARVFLSVSPNAQVSASRGMPLLFLSVPFRFPVCAAVPRVCCADVAPTARIRQ